MDRPSPRLVIMVHCPEKVSAERITGGIGTPFWSCSCPEAAAPPLEGGGGGGAGRFCCASFMRRSCACCGLTASSSCCSDALTFPGAYLPAPASRALRKASFAASSKGGSSLLFDIRATRKGNKNPKRSAPTR